MKKVCSNCHRLKHHKNSIHCFGCGKKLTNKSSRVPFKKIVIGVGILLALSAGIIAINFGIEVKQKNDKRIAMGIKTLPSQWQHVAYMINSVAFDTSKVRIFNNIVSSDLPQLSSENIFLLMSLFGNDHNKTIVASKLMEFRK